MGTNTSTSTVIHLWDGQKLKLLKRPKGNFGRILPDRAEVDMFKDKANVAEGDKPLVGLKITAENRTTIALRPGECLYVPESLIKECYVPAL